MTCELYLVNISKTQSLRTLLHGLGVASIEVVKFPGGRLLRLMGPVIPEGSGMAFGVQG